MERDLVEGGMKILNFLISRLHKGDHLCFTPKKISNSFHWGVSNEGPDCFIVLGTFLRDFEDNEIQYDVLTTTENGSTGRKIR